MTQYIYDHAFKYIEAIVFFRRLGPGAQAAARHIGAKNEILVAQGTCEPMKGSAIMTEAMHSQHRRTAGIAIGANMNIAYRTWNHM